MHAGGTGPATHLSADDLKNAPSINRDLKDIVHIDLVFQFNKVTHFGRVTNCIY